MRIRFFVFLCALGMLSAFTAQAQEAPQPTLVRAATAERKPFVDRAEALGTLQAKEGVELSVNVTETVTAVHFEDNQRVDEGYVLVEMTNAEENAQLSEARATVSEARKQYKRAQRLVKQQAASQALLDQRRREYETAKAQLEGVSSRMEDRVVMAPFAGVVGLRNISVGALVQPGDLITTIDDDSVMKLDFTVPSTYLNALEVGMQIQAKARGLDGRLFEGKVTAINSRIDPVTRSIKVRARLPNPGRLLKPGLLMTVELLKNPRQALVIPESALMPRGTKNFVYVVDESKDPLSTVKREVEIGARRPGEVEMLSGLEAGERVVTHGTIKVQPGQPITIQEDQ